MERKEEIENEKEDEKILDVEKFIKSTKELIGVRKISEKVKLELLTYIRNNVIGDDKMFNSAYGDRKITYCDYVASGRFLRFIEDFLRKEVVPLYANTHTTSSITGKQSTCFREEARDIIFHSTSSCDQDILIFCGEGTTQAINTLVNALDLRRFDRVVVFLSVLEHHSNILPWREAGAKIITIPEDEEKGGVNSRVLEKSLRRYSSLVNKDEKVLLIGTFTAASNITGMLTDTKEITRILHKYGSLAFFDYACSAPYSKIEMNSFSKKLGEEDEWEMIQKDAIFFSTHKLLGGPGGPGVLIVKKRIIKSSPVVKPGGGTVFFVTEHDHTYLKEVTERQEGGTPNILGTIRAGMSFHLKQNLGEEFLMNREDKFIKHAFKRFENNPKIVILGNLKVPRLSVLTFLVKVPLGDKFLFLHSTFVSALLNDLFGIQSRAGCMCAGIYAASLLGLSYKRAKEIENVMVENEESYGCIRPGFTRLNFHFFMNDEMVDYVLDCIEFIVEHGWKFLIEYVLDTKSGNWVHFKRKKFERRKWIHDISYDSGEFGYEGQWKCLNMKGISSKECFAKYLKFAKDYVKENFGEKPRILNPSYQDGSTLKDVNEYRWFMFPSESVELLKYGKVLNYDYIPDPVCIQPKIYEGKPANIQKVIKINHENEEEEEGESDDEENELFKVGIFEDDEEELKRREKKIKKNLWKHPPPQIMKSTMEALEDFTMIRPGDKLLLGLSGGKDSLTMLHILKEVQVRSKIKFEFGCCTVDPQADGFDPSPLVEYCKKLEIPYFLERQNIIEMAKKHNEASICSFCSRMRRGVLYTTARKKGYNVLILAQHLDDLVESFFMSIMHNGCMRTMKAHYTSDAGDIRIIRPLVYVRERKLREFSRSAKLPVIFENCPACFEVPKERERIKKVLKAQESLFPKMYSSFMSALKPLMKVGEFVGEDRMNRKFKSRKTKDLEEVSAISGVTKGVMRQLKVLATVETKYLLKELEKRRSRKNKKGQKEGIVIPVYEIEKGGKRGESKVVKTFILVVLFAIVVYEIGKIFFS